MNGSTRLTLKQFTVAACITLALSFSAHGRLLAQSAAVRAPAAAPATPTVDQILDRYVEATGGRAAWQKLTSRITTGTIDAPSMNLSGKIEIREKAPDRVLAVITIAGASFRQGFDGTAGWTDDPENGLREQSGPELAEARRDADFYHGLDMHKLYGKLTLIGTEKIGSRLTYVVEAALPEGGTPDRFYFDAQTGLRLRVISRHHDAEGVLEQRVDYDDYREVDGVRLPFVIHETSGDSILTIKISEVRHNVVLDDSQFAESAVQ
jgi:zinc protease